MELDARLLITLGGMLISVITSFIVVGKKFRKDCTYAQRKTSPGRKGELKLFMSL
jgi:hypothetical protein